MVILSVVNYSPYKSMQKSVVKVNQCATKRYKEVYKQNQNEVDHFKHIFYE